MPAIELMNDLIDLIVVKRGLLGHLGDDIACAIDIPVAHNPPPYGSLPGIPHHLTR